MKKKNLTDRRTPLSEFGYVEFESLAEALMHLGPDEALRRLNTSERQRATYKARNHWQMNYRGVPARNR